MTIQRCGTLELAQLTITPRIGMIMKTTLTPALVISHDDVAHIVSYDDRIGK